MPNFNKRTVCFGFKTECSAKVPVIFRKLDIAGLFYLQSYRAKFLPRSHVFKSGHIVLRQITILDFKPLYQRLTIGLLYSIRSLP